MFKKSILENEVSCSNDVLKEDKINTNKVLIQVDSVGYRSKPDGKDIARIKNRTQNSEPIEMSVEKLAEYIGKGHSYSPGILKGGLSSSNWSLQQMFCVDIDNEEAEMPIMTPKEAVQICHKNGIRPTLVYNSFSSTTVKPKFRLGFVLDKPIQEEAKRKMVVTALIALFPQADKCCKNADRLFFGTDKQIRHSENRITYEQIEKIAEQQAKKEAISNKVKTEVTSHINSDLDELKANFDFKGFLDRECGEIVLTNERFTKYKKCPICGHNDDFVYYHDTNRFTCFGKNGNTSGSIIDYLIKTRNMDKKSAIEYFKYDLCGLPKDENKEIYSKLKTISSKVLLDSELPPVYWVVQDFLPQGLAILASLPKFGKSWFVLKLCSCVAKGESFLGYETTQSDVLYMALEDSLNRIKGRLAKILGEGVEAPDNLRIATEAFSLSEGLPEIIEAHLKQYPDTKLIVIDTLQKVRNGAKRNEGAYAADYREVSTIKKIADKHGICILIVHHVKKGTEKDAFSSISGTFGITGSADTMYVMTSDDKESSVKKLHITGRDVERSEMYIEFKNYEWEVGVNVEIQEEQRRYKEYDRDPVVIALRQVLRNNDYDWSGTATRLLHDLQEYNRCLHPTAAKLARKLKGYIKELEKDGIIYTPAPPNGSGGKRIHKFQNEKAIREGWLEQELTSMGADDFLC